MSFFRGKYAPVIDVMGGIRVNTSLQGVPIPILYGRNRIAPNLIWYSDFFWEQIVSGKKGGTRGGGTGKKAGGEYDYGAAVILGLCQGPIVGIGNIWTTTGNLPSQIAIETFTVPPGGGSYTALNQASYILDVAVTRADGYSVVVNDFGSVPSSITLTGTQQTPMKFQAGSGTPATGSYTRTGIDNATYNFAAGDAGKLMTIQYSYAPPFTAGGLPLDPINTAGFTLFNGTQGQPVWSYLTSKHPSQAIGYSTLAYLATPVLDLGMSAVTPNFNFEVFGLWPYYSTSGSAGTVGGKSPLAAEDTFTNLGGSLSGNWTVPTGNWAVFPAPAFPPFVLSSAAQPSHVVADGSANAMWNANTFPPDQTAQMTGAFGGSPTITSHPTGYIGPAVRMAPSGETYYTLLIGNVQILSGVPSLWRLDKVVAGVRTNLANGTVPLSIPIAIAGPEYSLTVAGTLLTARIGGTVVAAVTDASIASGQPGMAAYNIAGVTDNWQSVVLWQASQSPLGANPLGPSGDSNPADVLNDMFTNPLYGCGVNKGELGDFSSYSAYCVSQGLFISPVMDQERTAADWVRDILDATNSELVESGGLLKLIPYGDTSVVGNGVQYTPATNPIYNLTADNFIRSGTTPPIEITRPSVQDAYNAVRIEYSDRGNAYNAAVIEAQDLLSVQKYKYRPDSIKQYHMFTSQAPASLIAQLQLLRHTYIRNTYKFKLPSSFILLDPMDLVTIPAQLLGMAATLPAVPVRITSIDEQADRTLDVTAEQFPWGTAGPTLYPKQALLPGGPNVNAPPGSVSPPTVFEALSRMNNQIGHTLWFGVCGQQAQTAIIADNFSRSALGSNWSNNLNAMDINNSIDYEPSNTANCATRWTLNSPFPPDQSSKAVLTAIGGTAATDTIGVAARMDSGGAQTFYAAVACANASTIALIKCVTGTVTTLSSVAYTPTIGDVIEIRTIGTLIQAYVNGVLKTSAYDTAIASGQPGIFGSKTASGTALIRANNWTGSQAYSTNPNWGGCRIWLSNDGVNYKQIATAVGATKMGVLSASLASHADPDTTDTLSVDLTESAGVLAGFTSAQTDLFASLCYVDGEMIAYQSATLTSEFQYNLATKLRRGVYNSVIGSHAAGTKFMFLDDSVEGYNYDPSLIGQSVFFKFTSFNQSGLAEELLANVTAYSYTVTGASIGLLAPAHASYRPTSNPLTAHDAGASVTINIASFSMRVPGQADIPFGSGAITGLSYSTLYYVYFDDPGFLAESAPTYVATTTKTDALNGGNRFFVGSILTPKSGAPDTTGNNDGGGGAQIGNKNILNMTSATTPTTGGNAAITNPSFSYDGDLTTFAKLTLTGNGSHNAVGNYLLQGPPGITRSYSSATAYVRFAVPTNSLTPVGTGQGVAQLIFNWIGGAGTALNVPAGTTAALQTVGISLPLGLNLSQVFLSTTFSSFNGTADCTSGSLELDIYEAWIEADE